MLGVLPGTPIVEDILRHHGQSQCVIQFPVFTVSTFGTPRGELGVESWWILESVAAPTSSCREHRNSVRIYDLGLTCDYRTVLDAIPNTMRSSILQRNANRAPSHIRTDGPM